MYPPETIKLDYQKTLTLRAAALDPNLRIPLADDEQLGFLSGPWVLPLQWWSSDQPIYV